MIPPFSCDEDRTAREVAALRLREDMNYPAARHHLADALGGLVARLVAKLETATHDEGMPPLVPPSVKPLLASATATAVGAVEGTLKAKSLDGALKAAQIEQAYADAREKNAAAALREAEMAKVRVETRKLEREAAIAELGDVLHLLRTIGVPIDTLRLPNSTIGIALGENLSSKLPAHGVGPLETNTGSVPDPSAAAHTESSPEVV